MNVEIDGWTTKNIFKLTAIITIAITTAVLFVSVILYGYPPMIIPIANHIVKNLGDLPQWIIALVALGSFWKSSMAAKQAAIAVTKIEEVRHETNTMRAELQIAKKAEGKSEGKIEGVVEGRKDAHNEQVALVNAETAAKVSKLLPEDKKA